ncbi:BamA/TamA family outer membrane protein [Candidatus Uabimicrobium amorphum]|uniref:Peptidase S9 n=1 Tax=Uabimicrobium amorphum TaxID=2596890 RepID=A0A5S9F0U7_UABAM|nr:BamA/TamA family outer membrane protein [Candidatus Uabimicrobium amorphum]BBM81876.1 peptidase S9 [Candidatus Uabimicrobium amorphum]
MRKCLLILCSLLLCVVYCDDENAVIALKAYKVLATPNFDIHFSVDSLEGQARKAGRVLEAAHKEFKQKLNLKLPDKMRISVVLYESQGSFQRTNIKSTFGIKSRFGFSEPVRKRIVLWVSPSERDNIYQLRLNLAQMLVFHYLFPEADYTIFVRYAYSEWIMTGIPIYLAGIDYDPFATAAFVDALFSNRLRPLVELKGLDHLNRLEGASSYRYMAEVFRYIEEKYGLKKVRQILYGMKFQPADCILEKALGKDEYQLSDEVMAYLRKKWGSEYHKMQHAYDEQLTKYQTYYRRLDFSPSLSADGQKMLFLSDRRDNEELYVMDTKTLDTKRLLAFSQGWWIDQLEGFEFPAACSPDGKFAVVKGKDAFSIQLFIIDLNAVIAEENLYLGFDDYAGTCYAPDGKSFVFVGINSGDAQLYRYDIASRNVTQLTFDKTAKLQPSFSPDGKKVLYIAEVDLDRDIFILDLETQEQKHIKNVGMQEGFPILTNDNKILCTTNNGHFINLARTDIDGKNWEILTNVPGVMIAPTLTRDNKWLYYTYYHDQEARLYRVRYDKWKSSSNANSLKADGNPYIVPLTSENEVEKWKVSEYEANTTTDYIFPFLAVNVLRFSDIVGAHQVDTQFGVFSGAILDPNNGGSNVDVDVGVQGSVSYTFANFLTFSLYGGVQLADDNDDDDDDDDDDNDDDFDYFAGTDIFTTFNITPRIEIQTGYTLIYQKTSDDDFEEEEFWSGGIFFDIGIDNRYTRGIDVTYGYSANLRVTFFESFLGSDDSYQLISLRLRYYWSVVEDHIIRLAFDADVGTAGFPGLFDLGGNNAVRGLSEDDLEGTERLFATMEYRFPIYRDWNYFLLNLGVIKDIRGILFCHVGTSTDDVFSKFENYNEVDFVFTVGAGLRIDVYPLENFDLPLGVQVAQRLDESDSPIVYFFIDN